MRTSRPVLAVLALLCACETPPAAPPRTAASPAAPAASVPPADPFAADEARLRAPIEWGYAFAKPTLIRGGTVLTATGQRYAPGFVLTSSGQIAAVGPGLGPEPDDSTVVVDARGKFVTPGLIDPHSHIGVYPVPETAAHDDGNEVTDPVTAGLRAEDSFWPQDPSIERAVAGGVTTIGVLPGSANLIGGRGVVMHLLPRRGARAMRFGGAPEIVKFACGENPKRTYGGKGRAPSTRMGNLRAVREAFLRAQKYARDWQDWTDKQRQPREPPKDGGKPDEPPKPPDRDLGLETLALVMRGDILVQWHCYQADDMLAALSIADEFGFKVRAFHHALEAYKIRDVLARRGVGVATWDDWWGFKMEAYDGIPENLALLAEAGVRAAVHSDSEVAIQILNQAAAKSLAAGRAAGIQVDAEDALRWLTANPAWELGIGDLVGTLEPGKLADIVVWSEDPLSAYALAERVYIVGALAFDRAREAAPWSDFELGLRPSPSPDAVIGLDGGAP